LRFSSGSAAAVLALALPLAAAPALRSGPQPGERPLPFTSNIVTGPYRGKQHCYVCELKDEPAVLVFARRTDEATARLLQGLRDAVRERRQEKLFAWMVFLGAPDTDSQTDLERRAYEFARSNGAAALPISALGEPLGPPGYQIAPEAAATVLGFQSGKILYSRAFRRDEWTPRAAESVLKELPKALPSPSR
jgi:hypothetical protein